MKLLGKIYASVRAFLIAGLAGGTALSQERGFVDQEEADWDAVRREAQREGGGGSEAFQRYLEQHPAGRHAPRALKEILAAPLPGPRPGPGPAPAAGPPAPAAGPREADLY